MLISILLLLPLPLALHSVLRMQPGLLLLRVRRLHPPLQQALHPNPPARRLLPAPLLAPLHPAPPRGQAASSARSRLGPFPRLSTAGPLEVLPLAAR